MVAAAITVETDSPMAMGPTRCTAHSFHTVQLGSHAATTSAMYSRACRCALYDSPRTATVIVVAHNANPKMRGLHGG